MKSEAVENEHERTNKPKESEANAELHIEMMQNIKDSMAAEFDQRTEVIDDTVFGLIEGGQTDDATRCARDGRPNYEVNQLALPINQALSQAKQNQVSIKIRPNGGGSNLDMAETWGGLIRHIKNNSGFESVKAIGAKEQFAGGYGAWQVVTEFTDDDSFEQDIKIKPIHGAANSVYFDPGSTDQFHADSDWCAVIQGVSISQFKKKYGKDTAPSSVDIEQYSVFDTTDDNNVVRIVDYWMKEPYEKTIISFSDGTSKELDDELEKVLDEMAKAGIAEIDRRAVKSNRVVHYKISASEILEGPHNFPGKLIPVIPVYGYSLWVNGKHFYRGMVRLAKDSQRIYNYVTSAKVEQTAANLSIKPMATRRQISGNQASWEDGDPTGVRFFNADPMVPNGHPIMPTAPPVNGALIEQAQQAAEDLKITVGKFTASLGTNPSDQSGKALNLQKAQGDLGTFELQDNLVKADEHTVRIIMGIMPTVYDTERNIRILGEDGVSKFVPINTTIRDEQTGKMVIVPEDVLAGKYDMVTDVGPSFKTQRAEVAEQMAFVMQTSPESAALFLDLWLKALDSPIAQEAADRQRSILIQQGQIEPNEEELQKMQEKAQAQEQQGPSFEEQAQMALVEAEVRTKTAEASQSELDLKKSELLVGLEIAQAEEDIDKTETESTLNLAKAEDALRQDPVKPPAKSK